MATPTGSTFPGSPDNFPAATPSTVVLPLLNRVLDALNKMQAMLLGTTAGEVIVQAVTVAPSQRLVVTLSAAATIAPTASVTATVLSVDGALPLVVDGVSRPNGLLVQVAVFNRDGANTQTGTICLRIDRP